MGYDSRIFVVKRAKNEKREYGQIIAMFDCGVMGQKSWYELFNNPVKYDVYIKSGDIPTRKDCYGDKLQEAPINSVIDWLEKEIEHENYYRRLPPLLALLKGFNVNDWQNELYIIHYGH